MASLKLTAFSGEVPRLIPRLLPDMAAQSAVDVRLVDGGLTPIRKSRTVHTFESVPDNDSVIFLDDETWRVFPRGSYVVRAPVADDRLYIMGDGKPKMLVSGTEYDLELLRPSIALTASVDGTLDEDLSETKLYSYTLVTEIDGITEESEPCPLSNEVLVSPDMTVTLSGFQTGQADRGIAYQRIYRTQSGRSGVQAYLIAERDVSTSDFTDDDPFGETLDTLPSLDYNPPPDGLTGLVALPNGMMAAHKGKSLYFCEPYRPHAWPEKYILQTDYTIVGLGAFGTSVGIMTTGVPYVASGTAPDSMQMSDLELNLPCINARAIQDLGYSVVYPSFDGLVVMSEGGARVVTEEIFYRDQWLRLNPDSWTAGQFDGRYFASYVYQDSNGEEQIGSFIVDLSGGQPFIIRSKASTRSYYYSVEKGRLYYLKGQEVMEYDALGESNTIQEWKSKQFVLKRPENFTAMLVEADEALTEDEIEALEALAEEIEQENQEIFEFGELKSSVNAAAVNELAVNDDLLRESPDLSRSFVVNVYADGELFATITDYNKVKRMKTGRKYKNWEIEVFSDIPISQINMASSVRELNAI